MKYASLTAAFLTVFVTLAYGQNPTESQSFDSAAAANGEGWRESGGNRMPEINLDFGFSESANASGNAGESGGLFPGFTPSGVNYYGDLSIGEWTLEDELTASGKVFWSDLGFDGGIFVGWFDARDPAEGTPPDHLGFEIREGGSGTTAMGLSNGDFQTKLGQLGSANIPVDTQVEFTLNFDPLGGVFGFGELSLTSSAGGTNRLIVRETDSIFGADLNAFGIFNTPRDSCAGTTEECEQNSATAFVDDLSYTSNGEPGPAFMDTVDSPVIRAGDANLDQEFNTADVVAVLAGNKFEKDEDATWAEGDWDGAPNDANTYATGPPAGDGRFGTTDVVAALAANWFESGPIAAALKEPGAGDDKVTISYDAATGQVGVQATVPITSVQIDSASGVFSADPATNLGGPFDVHEADKIFKAVFGGEFTEVDFGTVAEAGLDKTFLLNDLSASGSLAGGGTYGAEVEFNYIPEPGSMILLGLGVIGLTLARRRMRV